MAWIVQKPNGKYLVRWRDLTGRTRSHQCDSLDDAELAKDSYERNERRSNPSRESVARDLAGVPPSWFGWSRAPAPQYMFENYLRTLIDSDKELRQTSRETYLHSLKNHIAGTPLGCADVRAITPEMVKEFWAELDVGVGALRNVYQLLAKAFNHALNVVGVMSFSPLARAGIKRPAKGRREEIVPLTVSEIERLATAAMHPRDRAAILLMAYAGLRAGEVGGLRVQDVDFEKCRVSLRQQVVQTHREKSITPLKTRAARRTIEVACSVTVELKAFIEVEPLAADGRIFHGVRGISDLWAHSKINRQVQKAAKAAGLRPVHAHLLRHTAVSLLIDDGANPKAIQAFVGHSNITETLQTYGHLFLRGFGAGRVNGEAARRVPQHQGGVVSAHERRSDGISLLKRHVTDVAISDGGWLPMVEPNQDDDLPWFVYVWPSSNGQPLDELHLYRGEDVEQWFDDTGLVWLPEARRELYEQLPKSERKRPTISVGGDLPTVRDRAVEALTVANNPPVFFRRGGLMTEIALNEKRVPSARSHSGRPRTGGAGSTSPSRPVTSRRTCWRHPALSCPRSTASSSFR